MPRIGEQDHGDAFRGKKAKPSLSREGSALAEDASKAKAIFLHPPGQSVTAPHGVDCFVLHRVDRSVRNNSFLVRQMSLEVEHSEAKQIVSAAINSTLRRRDNDLGVAGVTARRLLFQARFKGD